MEIDSSAFQIDCAFSRLAGIDSDNVSIVGCVQQPLRGFFGSYTTGSEDSSFCCEAVIEAG